MGDELVVELLNGMPLVIFYKWFILAMGGALLYFVIRLIGALGPEKVTKTKAEKWSWRHFFTGFLKLVVTLIVAPWFILYFDVVAPVIFEFIFQMGATGSVAEEHQYITIELNGLSAFGLGFSIDFITRRVIKKYFKKGK